MSDFERILQSLEAMPDQLIAGHGVLLMYKEALWQACLRLTADEKKAGVLMTQLLADAREVTKSR